VYQGTPCIRQRDLDLWHPVSLKFFRMLFLAPGAT
jgi:hypothetical protein